MSDKKRSRRRKDEYTGPGGVQDEAEKPSKEEYTIAKWLKKNVRTKRTKFLSHNVEYFTATKALDALMKSKFAEGDNCLFPSREHAIEFLDVMLEHKFFHRAKKVQVFPEDLKGKSKKLIEKESTGSTTVVKRDTIKDDKEKEKSNDQDSHAEGSPTTEEQGKEKKKRKIKLDMHPEQVFVDGSEAYVWIYDPVPIHYWIYGMALVLGAIIVCLFPLWPPILRKGVYYLSIAAAGFLVFILALTVLRLIIFVIVWVLSGGKLYFWIFPNLTEDVGFLASFWPLYESEYYVESESSKSNKKSKKKKKEKDSDAEDDAEQPLLEPEIIENIKENETGSIVIDTPAIVNDADDEDDDDSMKLKNDDDDDDDPDTDAAGNKDSTNNKKDSKDDDIKLKRTTEGKENTTPSESESEGSRSSTGKDFEIVDAPEAET